MPPSLTLSKHFCKQMKLTTVAENRRGQFSGPALSHGGHASGRPIAPPRLSPCRRPAGPLSAGARGGTETPQRAGSGCVRSRPTPRCSHVARGCVEFLSPEAVTGLRNPGVWAWKLQRGREKSPWMEARPLGPGFLQGAGLQP